MNTGGQNYIIKLAFLKLEGLLIKNCSKLTKIPGSCFPSIKTLKIKGLENSSMILETVSRNASSLEHVQLEYTRQRRVGHPPPPWSNTEFIFKEILENNSVPLISLDMDSCKGLTYLTLGEALEKLAVCNCSNLASINVVEGSRCLTELKILCCNSLLQWASTPSPCYSLISYNIPWAFSSYSATIPFPNLIELDFFGPEMIKKI